MNLLVALGMQKHNIVVCDSKGVIYKDREPNMAETKAAYAVERRWQAHARRRD